MKKIIILFLLNIFNLYAVEEIELQWEDISQSNDNVLKRDIFIDNDFNIYTKPYFYLYKYSNNEKKWSTLDIPEINEDFPDNIKVFVNGKSDMVIYSIYKNELYIKNQQDNDWQKYIINDDNDTIQNIDYMKVSYYDNYNILLYVISNKYKYYGNLHVNLENQKFEFYNNQKFVFPSDNILMNSDKNNYIGITDNKIGFLDLNLKIIEETRYIDESNNFLDLNTDNLIPFFVGLNDNNINYICQKENIISIFGTSDFGENWSLLTKTNILDDYSIYQRLSYIKNNYIVIVLQNNKDKTQIKLMCSDDYGDNWVTVNAPQLPNDGFSTISNCFINNNKELFLATNSKFYRTNLINTQLSIENETVASPKNLSVLYGNISDNILNINIESGINSIAKISLYSSDMKAIEQFNEVNFMQGTNELTFRINSQLSTGVYYVFIESGTYKHFYKIIK